MLLNFLTGDVPFFQGARGVTPVLPPQGEWTYELLGTGSEVYLETGSAAERFIMRNRHGSPVVSV